MRTACVSKSDRERAVRDASVSLSGRMRIGISCVGQRDYDTKLFKDSLAAAVEE
jgi:hypothetical protein